MAATPATGLDGAHLNRHRPEARRGLQDRTTRCRRDATHLSALWHISGGDPETRLTRSIRAIWSVRQSDHDNDPMQQPLRLTWAGGRHSRAGSRRRGPTRPCRFIAIKDVPEKFAGWMHLDDLGTGNRAHRSPGRRADRRREDHRRAAAAAARRSVRCVASFGEARRRHLGSCEGKDQSRRREEPDRPAASSRRGPTTGTTRSSRPSSTTTATSASSRSARVAQPGHRLESRRDLAALGGQLEVQAGRGRCFAEGAATGRQGEGLGRSGRHGSAPPARSDQARQVEDVQPASPKYEGDARAGGEAQGARSGQVRSDRSVEAVRLRRGREGSCRSSSALRMMKAPARLGAEGRLGLHLLQQRRVQPYQPATALEWPDLGPLMKIPSSGDAWSAFGMQWGASGATNGTGSQPRRALRGLRGREAEDQRQGAGLAANTPVQDGIGPAGGVRKSLDAGLGLRIERQGGKALFGGPRQLCAGVGDGSTWASAMRSASGATRPASRRCASATGGQWMAHSWLVGDLATKSPLKGGVTVYVDQGCFAKGTDAGGHEGHREREKLVAEDCNWIETNEEEFDQRIKDFLGGERRSTSTVNRRTSTRSRPLPRESSLPTRSLTATTHQQRPDLQKQSDGSWTVDAGETASPQAGAGRLRAGS